MSQNMVLASHSDASYLNVSKSRSRGGSYILCSENDAIPRLNGSILTLAKIIKCVMSSAAEAYCGRAVNEKVLVALSDIGTQQAVATVNTNEAIHQLLDYVATYPNDGITYRASDMVLASHSDAS